MVQPTFCECIEFPLLHTHECSPQIDKGMDPVLSVSVASRTCFFVVSDGTFASPFHFIVPLTLKVLDDDLIKVFMGVAWNSCSCANCNGIEGFGTSWIKAPLLKKTVPVGDTERLDILIGCCMFFFLSMNIWRFDPSSFLCITLIVLYSSSETLSFKSKYLFVDRLSCIFVTF